MSALKSPKSLNLFYEEPETDRWFPYDRYPRRVIRRIVRGRPNVGGQKRVLLNLCSGLSQLKIPYRLNNYSYIQNHPSELACIVGKPYVLNKIAWKNPILFGAAVYSHPIDNPDLLDRFLIRKILVPGPWMKEMCEPFWGSLVDFWPVGIDTEHWCPITSSSKSTDVLLYDKVRWDHPNFEESMLMPIRKKLRRDGRTFEEIRYGFYKEEDFHAALARCKSMIFLCEHETQGIAYQQALSCGVPIFAWDRKGPWKDPSYYPGRVIFEPVTSVPYWDERCGQKFDDYVDFELQWPGFWDRVSRDAFVPRDYILENLTLKQCAMEYYRIAEALTP